MWLPKWSKGINGKQERERTLRLQNESFVPWCKCIFRIYRNILEINWNKLLAVIESVGCNQFRLDIKRFFGAYCVCDLHQSGGVSTSFVTASASSSPLSISCHSLCAQTQQLWVWLGFSLKKQKTLKVRRGSGFRSFLFTIWQSFQFWNIRREVKVRVWVRERENIYRVETCDLVPSFAFQSI